MNLLSILAASMVISAVATGAPAQTISPEEIAAMVEDKVATINPYQELLNNPDPARSLAAMQIMLESGDAELVRLALEFGILSPSSAVRRTAFESYLTSQPVFSITIDGKGIKDNSYVSRIRSVWNGTLDADGTGYWRIPVGPPLPEQKCHTNIEQPGTCFVTVNADGIFLTATYLNARGEISEDGRIVGVANVDAVAEPLPFSIKLLD